MTVMNWMTNITRPVLVACMCCLAVSYGSMVLADETCMEQDMQIYLLIGQSNMAGRAPIPEDATEVPERCYLLNADNEWEPAMNPLNRYSTIGKGDKFQKLGPGYSFAKAMLEHDPNAKIGLIVNARGGTKIEQWLSKSKYYWGIRGRAKKAPGAGTIRGVLWHQGEANSSKPDEYMEQLKVLIGNLRGDLDDPNLPFVAGQIKLGYEINDVIAKLPDTVHMTGVAKSDGLKTYDRWHFDTESQLELGRRYAAEMIRLQKKAAEVKQPTPPTDMQFIDVHVHAHPCREGGLDIVADWMKRRNIERVIISPLNHKGSRAYTDKDRRIMLANFEKYKGKMYRMCIIDPGEVETVEEAVKILEREKAAGAIAFGEHYGKGLMFDDPKNLLLYEACEKVGLPVMFHIDQNQNKVEPGMQRVDNVLKQFPNCKVIAHAYWWRQLKDADRQLSEHPNLYADLSGSVVPNVLNRDREFARDFIIRHQDKLMFGTDEGWWSFSKEPSPFTHYTFFESLDLLDEVRYKIYRGNAEKLYGWEPKQPSP